MTGAAKPTDDDEVIFQYCKKCQRIRYAKPQQNNGLLIWYHITSILNVHFSLNNILGNTYPIK